ncbi:MAG: SUF system NifU family Fe-S cluster assembly protein [Clostridia bacterium]|nr:SUF system NifU family Fe-S cluster assembly protein [Clostridia bacterium]
MELNDLYTDIILEHSQNSYNKKVIENADITELGHNPSCGDEITLQIKFDGDIIKNIAYTGHGCAISQASASIMIDNIKGKTKKEALDEVELFLKMIKKEITDDNELEKLNDAIAFKNISNMPARVKCAVLAWHTLKESMEK